MSTVPAEWLGEVAVILVNEFTVYELAAMVPNLTAETLEKFVPLIVTEVPPPVGPAFGLIDVTVGTPMKVTWSADPVADVPPGVVTVISTVPADSAGDVAVILIDEFTVKELAEKVPNLTNDAFKKFVPLIVTDVPPWIGPEVGLMLVTLGP